MWEKILLVEDNELNCEIAHDLLTLTKAQVIVANNGEEAVKIFKNSKIGEINLILMDIQMPIMDGYMATKVIRELEREDSKNIEIIAMSANTFLDDIQKAKNCGMNDHIPKPIDIKKLMNILKKYN
ncbi:response regulator [Fusobacterium mortiferum]|uniref:Response regulator n=1 Tax=Fusobacterium mortiferum ATCC 9817 TaxID=469616 RepID=A0ABN5J735_FUSMR|nr:response regulator [Fusobacterium mortiferum]AVQ18352.1 response regulator [Fusobacterium mortiferum ATCC 9817]